MGQVCDIIKIDKYTNKIQKPDLLLMTRSGDIIGKISHYYDWMVSLAGNEIDEISFVVSKFVNGILCPIWDDLVDLKIVEVRGYGRFEISVGYTDNTRTEKLIHGMSLETELAQIPLYDFHVNDEDAMTMEITKYNENDFEHGNFIPTVFYDETDEKHSLLHRILADKAPHWKIGYVTPRIALSEEEQPEKANEFQRTYTVNGTSIYDLLTGEISEESNVVFLFDTINREINCYSLCDCIDQETGEVLARGIGEDTTILVSKNKLANEVSFTSNIDKVKNCFRIEGGDDIITDMVRAANMNGSNYIYLFADFQYKDMPKELADKIKEYHSKLEEQSDAYYGENGIYTRLCKAYDDLAYYESSMMPDVEIRDTTAEEQYAIMVNSLKNTIVGVSSVNNYNNNLFLGVSNNIEAMANILIDSRYNAKIIEGSTSYNSDTHTWTGNIQVARATDNTDYYPKASADITTTFSVTISDDELTFIKQKIEKALAKGSMLDIDFEVSNMNDAEIKDYFDQYCLNRLKAFYDGYNSCLSVLMSLNTQSSTAESSTYKEIYSNYHTRMSIVENLLKERQEQVDSIKNNIDSILKEQNEFQTAWDFQKYLGDDLYKIFCSYRREDTYTNNNYISDGLSTAECIAKAKELINAATNELKKACVLQRTVNASLNNLFALPEFEPLYDKFSLFNYIRIRTEDEILKLRIIGIEFNGDTTSEINVTFSEQVESVEGKMSDFRSIIQQAKSVSTSFPSTALQAKKGAQAKDQFNDIKDNGLNTANTMLTNNDNNEITITQSGIIGKRMDDEGQYGDKQFRLTGNMFAFTKDNWKNVELAMGEFNSPSLFIEKNESWYGLLASAIVGELIASEKLIVGNKEGNVLITSNGITIKNGLIQSANYSPNYSPDRLGHGSMIDLTDGTFSFAGGGLTYKDDKLTLKNGTIEGASGEFTRSFSVNIVEQDMQYSYESNNGSGDMILKHKPGNWFMETDKKGVHFGLKQHQGDDPQFPSSYLDMSLLNGIELTSNAGMTLRKPNGTIVLDCANVVITGGLDVGESINQNTNSIAEETQNYTSYALSSDGTTSSLSDMGHGSIGEDGLCVVNISETIDISDHEYYVFLQSYSNTNVYVHQKNLDHFVVKGDPNSEFDWEIKAKQLGYSMERLEKL